jgi:hypothetical protein
LIALLIVVALVWNAFLVWLSHDVWTGWQCYEPIQIGRPVAEAKGILEAQGFTREPVEGNRLSDEYSLRYRRGRTDPVIWISAGKKDDLVRSKSYNPGLLRWYQRVRIDYMPDSVRKYMPHI